ncbi:hypothetical protein [Kineosporia babensis]|uniref:Uncharacterized protein n=1 Tax=Kineosporia babensis TaxID=499548 RepID=A0A9X1NF73_9ACTN|nr:hypothetical protein [Kineosporia babensis]MCD5312950.1 hypothetical protein [Kineosporia babensis]
MSHVFGKAVRILVAVPLAGLMLAGCGAGSDSAAEPPTSVEDIIGGQASESPGASDINSLLVCDAVESALADAGEQASAQEVRTQLRKTLNAAFKGSTTPDVTIADSDVDRLMNKGCPGERAKALTAADMEELASLSARR